MSRRKRRIDLGIVGATTTTIAQLSPRSNQADAKDGRHSRPRPRPRRESGSRNSSLSSPSSSLQLRPQSNDRGHRYGNFSNYYSFNPPSNRMATIRDILRYVVETYLHRNGDNTAAASRDGKEEEHAKEDIFSYCDVGCNEGDLTMEIAKELQTMMMRKEDQMDSLLTHKQKSDQSKRRKRRILLQGVDLDPHLIRRANHKFVSTQTEKGDGDDESVLLSANFAVANVCNLKELEQGVPNYLDLLTIFSTTMWIHVHAGDEGFRSVLQHLCHRTKHFIVLEPQSSSSYRKVAVRLRKQQRQQHGEGDILDVSTNRLKLRTNIETNIDTILQENGFSKVEDTRIAPELRSHWNRSIRLYQRTCNQNIDDSMDALATDSST